MIHTFRSPCLKQTEFDIHMVGVLNLRQSVNSKGYTSVRKFCKIKEITYNGTHINYEAILVSTRDKRV